MLTNTFHITSKRWPVWDGRGRASPTRSLFKRVASAVAGCMTVLVLVASLPFVAGCATKAQTGALIGAGAGAAGGYIIGNEMDKSDQRNHHDYHHHHYRDYDD
jgi:Glycine zipper